MGRNESKTFRSILHAHEDILTVLNQEFEDIVLLLNIRHLARQALRPHDGRRKDDSDVLTGHQVLILAFDHALEMEDQELENVTVYAG